MRVECVSRLLRGESDSSRTDNCSNNVLMMIITRSRFGVFTKELTRIDSVRDTHFRGDTLSSTIVDPSSPSIPK